MADTTLRLSRRHVVLFGVGGLLWLTVIIAGLLLLIDYSSAPGITHDGVRKWPGGSVISRAEGLPSLVMFLHPRCACSRAGLNELARLLADCRNAVAVRAVFFCPDGESETWAHTDLWHLATRLSDAPPLIDYEGREATRFGATTSGHVLLFAPQGQRLYSGGITSGRGHEGDNFGCQAIRNLLDGVPVKRATFPVYGCPLLMRPGGDE